MHTLINCKRYVFLEYIRLVGDYRNKFEETHLFYGQIVLMMRNSGRHSPQPYVLAAFRVFIF